MDTVDWSKLDRGMRDIYRSYLQLQESNWAKGIHIHPVLRSRPTELRVLIEYTGDATPLEATGFRIEGRQGATTLQGFLPLAAVTAVSNLAQTQLILYGEEDKPSLTTSTTEIRARADRADLGNGVWRFNDSTDSFEGNTGSKTVIGIIDTGIDWIHETFRTTDKSGTRIISVWDQGMDPTEAKDPTDHPENGPVQALLSPGTTATYGVEYTQDQLNDAINDVDNSLFVRHRDTDGHGTHVAGIAAGNGMNPSFVGDPDFDRAGVAPEAMIIAVKYLGTDLTTPNSITRFTDALHYIVNKAATLSDSPPVVINASLGSNQGPHDGRAELGSTTKEEALHTIFNNSPGRIGVFSAGNEAGSRQHLEITIPASGNVEVPFKVIDKRLKREDTDTLGLDLWYSLDGAPGVEVAFVPPPGTAAGNPVALGDSGPAVVFDTNKEGIVDHFSRTATSSHGNATRANAYVVLTPFGDEFLTGDGYRLKISGAAGTVIHLWVNIDPNLRIDFDPAAISAAAGVEISNQSTIGHFGHSPDVFTVAAYDDQRDQLASFSSRGPLISYSGNNLLDVKPNIAAPGWEINSAKPENCRCGRGWLYDTYVEMDGTSQAAPHVAGLVALMLTKNKTLDLAQVAVHMALGARPGVLQYVPDGISNGSNEWEPAITPTSPIVTADEVGWGRIDVKATLDDVPASPVP